MALKIIDIVDEYEGSGFLVGIQFIVDFKKDGLILQKILRAIIHTYCVESTFGLGKNFDETLEFDYGCEGFLNEIIYTSEDGQYQFKKIKKKSK